MASILRAEGLTKRYGNARGVDGLSFDVEEGEVFGFLGPNGAGKTTTIRLLLDLIRPTSGRSELFGLDPRRGGVEIRRRIGYVPDNLCLYGRLTGRELLGYFARLRALGSLQVGEAVAQRLDVDLGRPIRLLSKGDRQKVGVAQALMHEPALLVLDEPTAGLDPLVKQTFYELLREVTARGSTVFLSSHVLPDVQRVADRVALIRNGVLELVTEMETLRRRAFTRVEATFAAEPPASVFAGLPGVRELERRGAMLRFALDGPIDPLVKALARFEVVRLELHEADLEDIFLARYGRDDGAG